MVGAGSIIFANTLPFLFKSSEFGGPVQGGFAFNPEARSNRNTFNRVLLRLVHDPSIAASVELMIRSGWSSRSRQRSNARLEACV